MEAIISTLSWNLLDIKQMSNEFPAGDSWTEFWKDFSFKVIIMSIVLASLNNRHLPAFAYMPAFDKLPV